MKKEQLKQFIKENGLLKHCNSASGIYCITIDDGVVYVGQSKNILERCSQHIYRIENAVLIKEQKYLLLLSAKLGGHRVDCHYLEYCDNDILTEREDYFIDALEPCLNILTPSGKQDINGLKIEDVLASIKYYINK